MEFSKKFKFHAAHRLLDDDSKCNNIHGHEYKLKVGFKGKIPEGNKFLISGQEIKEAVGQVLEEIDHSTLFYTKDSDFIEFFRSQDQKIAILENETTSENIAFHIAKKVKENIGSKRLQELGIKKIKVKLQETSTLEAKVSIAA